MADYGVVVLSQLADEASTMATAAGIAGATGLPAPTVSKLLKSLVHAGLVTSHRGAAGGYSLARSPVCISIAEVIFAIDRPVALTSCVEGAPDSCKVEAICPIRGRWDKVNAAVRRTLEEITLAELIKPESFVHSPPPAGGAGRSLAH